MLELAMIITAAGRSTRFPPNKLMETVAGMTCIEHTLKTFTHLNLDLFVVLGHEGERIQKTLSQRYGDDIRFVYNAQYESGLSSSVLAGIQTAGNAYDYWGFCPGDKPFIQTETVDALMQKLEVKQPLILAPQYKKKPGHPIFFSRELGPSFLKISGDTGGRQLLKTYDAETLKMDVSDRGVSIDMDHYLESRDAEK